MAATYDVIYLTLVALLKVQRKLIICTKYLVNRMNCVESSRGGGPIDPPSSSVRVAFFFEASRVKTRIKTKTKTKTKFKTKFKTNLKTRTKNKYKYKTRKYQIRILKLNSV